MEFGLPFLPLLFRPVLVAYDYKRRYLSVGKCCVKRHNVAELRKLSLQLGECF